MLPVWPYRYSHKLMELVSVVLDKIGIFTVDPERFLVRAQPLHRLPPSAWYRSACNYGKIELSSGPSGK